ncbi:MAG: ATP-binding protein [SAR324 cluster bacterium]|nr:ATP-binding protein [SAR324 cluster bacterium]
METKTKDEKTNSCRYCQGTYVVTDPITGDYIRAELCQCFPSPCPVCRDTRFQLEQDSMGREMAIACPECETRKRHIKLFNRARIPKNYAQSQLLRSERDKNNSHIFHLLTTIIRTYPKSKNISLPNSAGKGSVSVPRGLVLMGAPGTGKTHLMAGFVYQCTIIHGISCMFRPFDKLLSELKEGYSTGKSEMETISPLLSADFLIIDDLGKGRNTEWELNILDTLITERYNSNKPIMVTSNHTESEKTTIKERLRTKDKSEEDKFITDTLYKRVGERIYSRLREMCYFETLEGPDRREIKSGLSRTTVGAN